MLFNSYIFVFAFLTLFLPGFYLIGIYSVRRVRSLSAFIIAGSLLFFAFAGLRSLIIFILSLVVNYLLGLLIFRRVSDKKQEVKNAAYTKLLFISGVIINILAVFLFRQQALWAAAVSFYSFSQIWFLKDVYTGKIEKLDPGEYLFVMTFFPKLLQGPIVRYSETCDKMRSTLFITGSETTVWPRSEESVVRYGDKFIKKTDFEDTFIRAAFLFVMGLSKKVLLADVYAGGVNYVFDNVAAVSSYNAFLGAVLYSLQIYFDFSGYCDMGLALGLMMGIRLPINFDSPYKARNIDDFWKRWHISLTSFLTDAVYIPLGGNRKGRGRTYLNFLIIFLLSGLWHGSGMTFIVWGMMHGLLYIAVRFIRDKRGKKPLMPRVAAVILTFLYVTLAWVFFRAPDMTSALELISSVIKAPGLALGKDFLEAFMIDELWFVIKVTPLADMAIGSYICLYIFLALGLFLAFCCQNAYDYARTMKVNAVKGIIFALLLVWCVIRFGEVSTYIYSGF